MGGIREWVRYTLEEMAGCMAWCFGKRVTKSLFNQGYDGEDDKDNDIFNDNEVHHLAFDSCSLHKVGFRCRTNGRTCMKLGSDHVCYSFCVSTHIYKGVFWTTEHNLYGG